MFWGLTMLPNKRYTQEVENAFRISQAVLDPKIDGGGTDIHVFIDISGKSYVMCTLRKRDIVQVPLDLLFSVGDKISFYIKGNASIHLTGYIPSDDNLAVAVSSENGTSNGKAKKGKKGKKPEADEESSDDEEFDVDKFEDNEKSDSDEKSENDESENDNESASDDDDDDEDDDDDDNDDEEDDDDDDDDEEEDAVVQPKKKMKMDIQSNGKIVAREKELRDVIRHNSNQKSEADRLKADGPKIWTKEEQEQRKLNPIAFANQVKCEDLRIGKGPVIKNGQKIQVYYEGRLESTNRVFDSAKKGPGFKFLLGKGEVIRGWDIGVLGMKVGGKRRLTIPPLMGYGIRGSPPVIPSNATLIFDVEIRAIC